MENRRGFPQKIKIRSTICSVIPLLGIYSKQFKLESQGSICTIKFISALFNPWAGKIPWRKERLPGQVIWPGKLYGLYGPWGHKELGTTEQLSFSLLSFPDRSVGKIHLLCRRPQFDSWVRKIHWRRDRLPTPVFLGFPGDSAGKESPYNEGNLGLIPGLGRSPGEGKDCPLQCSDLENSIYYTVHGVTKSQT